MLKKLLQIFKTSWCKLKHQKYARALKEGGVRIMIFIFLSGELLYFFLGLCIRTNFLKCFAGRAVGSALQPQISVINVVSNLIASGLE